MGFALWNSFIFEIRNVSRILVAEKAHLLPTSPSLKNRFSMFLNICRNWGSFCFWRIRIPCQHSTEHSFRGPALRVHAHNPKFRLFCESISILLFRSLSFLFLSFLFLVLLPSFQERRKFYLERVVSELRNWQWIVPQNVTSFLCVALAGLFRISKIGYLRKDLPSLNSLPVSLVN